MFSAKNAIRTITTGLAGAALLGASAAMAGVIVKSSGPSAGKFKVGTKIADTATITLKSGDSVTVLTAKGSRVMKGAGTYRVGDKPTPNRRRFSQLTRKKSTRRVRTGAVRGALTGDKAKATRPNMWVVDVSKSGNMCVLDTKAVRLWRPSSEGIATYRVVDTANESSIDVTFDDGSSMAALDPARITVTEGKSYTVAGPEGTDVAEVTFVKLDAEYNRADLLAEALIEKGCMNQLSLLVEEPA